MPRTRLSADDRRHQLIGIGLRLLITTPIHALSIDEVAAQAGISRSLLFHYFPTKRDYYAAVVRAASRRMLSDTATAPEVAAPDRLRATLNSLVAFVDRRREPYLAFVRGAAGGDAWVLEIYEETRAVMVDLMLAALGLPADADASTPLRLQIRGWIAYAEELALHWTREPGLDRAELIDALEETLLHLARRTPDGAALVRAHTMTGPATAQATSRSTDPAESIP